MNSTKGGLTATDPEILTLKEVSEILRVHPHTVYKLVRQGKIPSFRFGGDWRFRRDRIVQWIGNQ
jgi:excisionase family DNA binding protein